MNKLLEKVKNIYQEGCVTITLNTHRTRPYYQKDAIVLKNLVREAERRLHVEFEKRFVWSVMEKLNKTVEKIDHSMNLESLVIFANQDFSDYTRLPVKVTDRVVIDNTFATRDLIRALHQESSYYVLVLSRQKARLIEAFNDIVIRESSGDPELENTLYITDKVKLSTKKGQDNIIEEFFNRVDKHIMRLMADNPMPIMVATETRNYDHYLKVTDRKDLILGHLNRNRDKEKAGNIVRDAWQEVRKIINDKIRSGADELGKAITGNMYLTDYNDIWNAILQGRGKTLFVRKGFYQPALITDNRIIPVESPEPGQTGIIDDIIDEIIEQNLKYGGNVVFIEGDKPENFGNIALVTRY